MIESHLKVVDRAIQRHGDGWWNEVKGPAFELSLRGDETFVTNREWILEELITLLAKDNLTLEVIRTNK